MLIENRFIYYPTREFMYTPDEFGVDFEDVFFHSEDGAKLHGWYVPAPGARTVMLFFHGNAGNLSDRIDNVLRLHSQVGADVFIIDYHGYGKSEGKPNEQNLCMDGRAAMEELRRRAGGKMKIVVFGRSLGGAVAVDLAARQPCDALIVESTFTSIPDIADALFPVLPAGRMLRTKFDSLGKIGAVSAPKLFIHGRRDSLIPFSHAEKLFDAAKGEKEFYPIAGADHNDTYIVAGDEYFTKIASFIEKIEG